MTQEKGLKDLRDEIRFWINEQTDVFSIRDIDYQFNIRSTDQKKQRSALLSYLTNVGRIKKIDGAPGRYRPVGSSRKRMLLNGDKSKPYALPLPLHISEMAAIYPGNIIVVSGTPNAGKTRFCINLCLLANLFNRPEDDPIVEKYRQAYREFPVDPIKAMLDADEAIPFPQKKIQYMNSEMGEVELANLLSFFPDYMDIFVDSVDFFEQTRNFADSVDPDAINIIDYIEVVDEFWRVGVAISEIHDVLKGGDGIAIVCLQKRPGAAVAKGGYVTIEKPRLVVNLDSNAPFGGIARIAKCKNRIKAENPEGLECDYMIYNGWRVEPISQWRFITEEDRARINLRYKNNLLDEKEYAFKFALIDGGVGQLNYSDLKKWREAYTEIDVDYCLRRLARESKVRPWMKPRTWFFQASAYLKRRNDAAVMDSKPEQGAIPF